MGAPPPSPRDLALLFSRMDAFRFTRNGTCRTIESLARRIGLSRDGTRAPMQVRNGWRPSGRLRGQPAAPSKNGRNFVQLMGSTSASESGNQFVVFVRQSDLNMMDFSVILGYRLPQVYTVFRLRRYNGKHQHTNVLEKQTFYDFHLHTATERYQAPGFKEDHFAETTSRHFDLESAIQCLIADCGFRTFEDTPLFGGIA
jgi:hypothetical protein